VLLSLDQLQKTLEKKDQAVQAKTSVDMSDVHARPSGAKVELQLRQQGGTLLDSCAEGKSTSTPTVGELGVCVCVCVCVWGEGG